MSHNSKAELDSESLQCRSCSDEIGNPFDSSGRPIQSATACHSLPCELGYDMSSSNHGRQRLVPLPMLRQLDNPTDAHTSRWLDGDMPMRRASAHANLHTRKAWTCLKHRADTSIDGFPTSLFHCLKSTRCQPQSVSTWRRRPGSSRRWGLSHPILCPI